MSKPIELPSSAAQHCPHCDPASDRPAPTLVPMENARTGPLGGISRSTLYALIAGGQLVQVHIGRRAFITGESIDSFLKGLA